MADSSPDADFDLTSEEIDEKLIHEGQLGSYLKSLFDVPSKNIGSAFELLLGLINKNSSEICNLKRANAKSSIANEKILSQLRSEHNVAADSWAREKHNILLDLNALKKENESLLGSQTNTIAAVEELKNELKILAFNFQGFDEEQESESDTFSDGDENYIHAEANEMPCGQESGDAVINAENSNPVSQASPKQEDDTSVIAEAVETMTKEKAEVELPLLRKSTSGRESICGRSRRGSISVEKVKLDADRTVAARLDKLEEMHAELIEGILDIRRSRWNIQNQGNDTEATEEMLEQVSKRIRAVEKFLDGFDWAATVSPVKSVDSETAGVEHDEEKIIDEMQPPQKHPVAENDEVSISSVRMSSKDADFASSILVDTAPSEENYPNNSSDQIPVACNKLSEMRCGSLPDQSPVACKKMSVLRRGSLLLHLKERDSKTELTLIELTRQIDEMKEKMLEHHCGIEEEVFERKLKEASEGLQEQITGLNSSIGEKASRTEVEIEIQKIHSIASSSGGGTNESSNVTPVPNEFWAVKTQLMEQINQIRDSKLDTAAFEKEMGRLKTMMKQALEQEMSKQQSLISSNAEKLSAELADCRNMIDPYKDSVSSQDGIQRPYTPIISLDEVDLDAKIQQATNVARASIEEALTKRLEELRTIEKEMDGLTSKLAEKPSQDQIASMLHDLEKAMSERLGKDKTLQLIIENMKLEMRQKLTRGEVMAMIKHVFEEAKMGIQNTKDTLMVGRIQYTKCLGCSQPYPSGVNGRRAPKVNHDALPPSSGLIPSTVPCRRIIPNKERTTTLYSSRGSLRPLQSLRSASRPKSAVTVRFSNSSSVRVARGRNNSR